MLTGVILAGGPNDQLNGIFKPLLPIENKLLVEHQINEMKKICQELMIVTNSPMKFLPHIPSDVRIITDFYKGLGVIGGLHSALSLAKNPYLWIVGCDMPSLSSTASQMMLKELKNQNARAAFPVLNEQVHLLHAIYNIGFLSNIDITNNSAQYTLDHTIKIEEEKLISQGLSTSFLFSIKNANDYLQANTALSKNLVNS